MADHNSIPLDDRLHRVSLKEVRVSRTPTQAVAIRTLAIPMPMSNPASNPLATVDTVAAWTSIRPIRTAAAIRRRVTEATAATTPVAMKNSLASRA